jgi:hypothetical protein
VVRSFFYHYKIVGTTMTSSGVRNQTEGMNSASGNNGNSQASDDLPKSPKHDTTSDSATPDTGEDEADHSSESDKLFNDTMEIPLTGGEETSQQDTERPLPQSPPADPSTQQHPKLGEASPFVSAKSCSSSDGSILEFSKMSDHPPGESSEDGKVPASEGDGPKGEENEIGSAQDDDSDSDLDYIPKSETSIWRFRMMTGKIVNNQYVQISVIVLIIVNALMMGLATFDFVLEDPQVDNIFSIIDRAFLVLFSIECLMQLIYLGVTLFADGWLVFDLLIVILSWSFESLQIVRAFRIFRAFRLITRVKPLRDLVLAIGAVMPRMYAIAALLLLIFYVFSVLFTELFSELPLSDSYFTTLDTSLFTCMEMMTLEWGEIAREVMTYEPWAWAPFGAFIMITGFIVFNLIVAVVCDAVSVTEKTVRVLDGFAPNNPVDKLAEAQERIDLLQCHIHDMVRTQQNVQNMIELMASELLNGEAERMKAQHREAELRIEMNRRMTYQKDMQSTRQIESLAGTYVQEKERRDQERKLKEIQRKASIKAAEDEEMNISRSSRILPERKKAKPDGAPGSRRSGFMSQLSFRSRGSQDLSNSNSSLQLQSPPASRRGLARDSSRSSLRSRDSAYSGSTANG